MKNRKHTLCCLNLILFLGSFFLFSLNSFSNTGGISASNYYSKHVIPKHDLSFDNSLQQVSEKETETESENDTDQLAELILPYLVSYFQSEYTSTNHTHSGSQALCEDRPIYLSVRNFRI